MCITEYDEARTFAEQREEGKAEGREEGREKQAVETVKKMLSHFSVSLQTVQTRHRFVWKKVFRFFRKSDCQKKILL